ncbi:hypothetical protein J0A67_17355 [Algoriphagus aestuariicola]|uniref:Uncharacterized protein n=1 Tax=Algoriphagus aestuariicola TaxID=1852016 RepID=A0ABS3BTL4_9BACT|nr:hypothetical protein [Algoriphagus aestuariicola]MBN7802647.1 hypothetical protein [Algoriphagus aestuariicola]
MPLTSGAGNMVTAEEIMPEDGAVTPNGPVVRGDPPSGEEGTDQWRGIGNWEADGKCRGEFECRWK